MQIKSNQIKSNQIKSNQIKLNSIILLFSLLFCGILLTITSCKNFLNAADVAEEIKEAIEIANSNPTTIYIEAPKNSGTLSQTQVKVKRKESFDLKFTPSDTWQFITWEVFDPTTDQIVQDYISFNDETKNEVKVKLLKATDKLIIRPKCFELPAVVSFTPSSSQAAYANEPIVITFNTPLIQDVMKYEEEYISIKDNSENVFELFESPSLSDDGKTLSLYPKGEQLCNYISSKNASLLTVNVALGTKIIRTEKYNNKVYTYYLTQNENSSFTVKYKAEEERIVPKEYDFFATASELHLNNINTISESAKFTPDEIAVQGELSDENYKAKLLQNHINNTFYIYGRYYDADSGVKKVTVTHERKYSKDGSEVYEIPSSEVSYAQENAEFFTQDGYTSFCIKYDIADDMTKPDYGDGAILVNVTVLDGAGNKAELKSFTVIKDSFFDLTQAYIENNSRKNNASGWWANIDQYDDEDDFYDFVLYPAARHIILTMPQNFVSYKNINLRNLSKSKFFLEYISKSGKTKQEMTPDTIMNGTKEKSVWVIDLDVESVNSLELTLYFVDNFGNEYKKVFTMPSDIDYFLGVDPQNGRYCFKVDTVSARAFGIYWTKDRRTEYLPIKTDSSAFSYSFQSPDNKLLFIASYDGEHDLTGDFKKVTEILPQNTSAQTDNLIKEISFKGRDFSVTLQDNIWNTYGLITYRINIEGYSFGGYITKDKGNVFTITDTSHTHDILELCKTIPVSIYALVEDTKTIAKEEKTYCINRAGSEGAYTYGITNDNQSPVLSNARLLRPSERIEMFGNDEEYVDDIFIITATDFYTDSNNNIYTSGINRFELYLNNEKQAVFNENDLRQISENTYVIPVYGRSRDSNLKIDCKLIVYDNNENISTVTVEHPLHGGFSEYDYSYGICSFLVPWYNNETINYYLHLYKFENGKWNFIDTNPQYINNYLRIRITSEGIYKIIPETEKKDKSGMKTDSPYLLNINPKSSGNYDLLMQSGSSKTSFAISSDQPVFVQTIVTVKDYNTCKTWDAATWESNTPHHIGDSVLEFSPDDHSPKRYAVPVEKIHKDECYVVIVHFSDGHTEMSEVFVKE